MDQTSRRRSKNQERRGARDVGGRIQPGSGAPAFCKGDVRSMLDLRMECKTTSKKTFTLKLDELLKITTEALMGGLESWVFQIEFQGQAGMNRKFAVIDWAWFDELRRAREPETTLYVSYYDAPAQSTKLSLPTLQSQMGDTLSLPLPRMWAASVTFLHPFKQYALIDWTLFQSLREKP